MRALFWFLDFHDVELLDFGMIVALVVDVVVVVVFIVVYLVLGILFAQVDPTFHGIHVLHPQVFNFFGAQFFEIFAVDKVCRLLDVVLE